MQVRFFSRLVCGPFGFATRAKKFGRPEPRASCPGPCSSPCRTVRSVPRGAPGSDVRASPSHTAKRAPPRATRSLASPPSAQRRGQDPLLPAPTKSYPPRRAPAPAPAPARESQSARWRRSPAAEAGRACSAAAQGIGMRGSSSLARDVAGVETKGGGGVPRWSVSSGSRGGGQAALPDF